MVTGKRMALFLIVATALPFFVFGEAVAGGGSFPNYPGALGFTLNTSTQVTALIVLDPNGPVTTGPPATSTGTLGAIAITKANVGTATAVFRVEPDSTLGELRFGCNLLLTNSRFVEAAPGFPGVPLGGPGSTFFNWLPPSVTLKLFSELGETLVDGAGNPVRIPAITGVISQQCAAFPRDKRDLDLALFNDVTQGLQVQGIVAPLPIQPLAPSYPDRTISGVTDPSQQWFSGILVLQVNVGFWQH